MDVSERTGLGPVETAVLFAVADLGKLPAAGYQMTTHALDRLETEHGIGSRYAYLVMQDLAASWRLHLPLLDGRGNWGSLGGDLAADPQYTEVRLSRFGALALAAERGELGPVPFGLIEGSLYRDGAVPSFDPARVIEALLAGSSDAGPPRMPTGGTIRGDLLGLLAGRKVRLQLGCTVVVDPDALVVTELPVGVGIDDARTSLEQQQSQLRNTNLVEWADYLPGPQPRPQPLPDPGFSFGSLRDESTAPEGVRLICPLAPDSDIARALTWLQAVEPLTRTVTCRLPAPMRDRLRSWPVDDGSSLRELSRLLG